jgi:hypothetical protein
MSQKAIIFISPPWEPEIWHIFLFFPGFIGTPDARMRIVSIACMRASGFKWFKSVVEPWYQFMKHFSTFSSTKTYSVQPFFSTMLPLTCHILFYFSLQSSFIFRSRFTAGTCWNQHNAISNRREGSCYGTRGADILFLFFFLDLCLRFGGQKILRQYAITGTTEIQGVCQAVVTSFQFHGISVVKNTIPLHSEGHRLCWPISVQTFCTNQ